MNQREFQNPTELAATLDREGYLSDYGLAAAVFLAQRIERPLFLEGVPGVGKTQLAKTMATVLDAPLIRLQCYGGIDASQALYDWNFPRQILHVRSATELGDRTKLRDSLYDPEFLIERPILKAIRTGRCVLLIDEIDRADDEFEALLLEVLEDNSVTIPELGPIVAAVAPLVILTSNRTREVHDALKRRCLYHWIAQPDLGREVDIVRRKVPEASALLARQAVTLMHELRSHKQLDLIKPPGVAESIDLAKAAVALGEQSLTAQVAETALGTFTKHEEDASRVGKVLPGLFPLPGAEGPDT